MSLDLNGVEQGIDVNFDYFEGDPAVPIAAAAVLHGFDTFDFETGTLVVSFVGSGTGADQLGILDGAAGISVSDNAVSFDGTLIGTFSGGADADLIIELTGAASLDAVQALVRAIAYHNTSDDPSTDPRAVSFQFADGGGASDGATATISVKSDDIAMISAQADGTDQAAIINAALANSHSSVLRLADGEFSIGSAIVVPDGKTLIGGGQGLTTIKLLSDFDFGNGNQAVALHDNSSLADLMIDVNKVNNGKDLSLRVNGVVGLGADFLVENVSTKNATGYAFWSNGQSAHTPASGVFRDCAAENSNILFETNFSDGVLFENCRGGDGDGDITNLGAFHPLAGSNNITFRDCYYKGSAISIDVVANIGDQRNIVFERFYGETTGPSLGAIIHGSFANEVIFIDSTIIAANNNAINIHNATVTGSDTLFQSGRIAFAVFSGSADMTNSNALAMAGSDFHGAVYGAYAIGSIVWNGGFLSATGGPGTAAYIGNATIADSTRLTVGGTAGADVLVSDARPDLMMGFGGNDAYYVDDVGDIVVEGLGGGNDAVWASVSYVLAAGVHVETLSTQSHGATAAINLAGNELANSLYGNAGANSLDGRSGADLMMGFGGNDAYYIDNVGDVVVEGLGGGNDAVWASVSYVLAAGVHVETLSTQSHGDAAAIDLTGNELANALYGNAGDNRLNGGGGADVLRGFGGNDTFLFDQPLGSGNVATILDFAPDTDGILLDNDVFEGLLEGELSASAFHTGAAAADASHRIIYDPTGGQLYFDADGSGSIAAVMFGIVQPSLDLSPTDFSVI